MYIIENISTKSDYMTSLVCHMTCFMVTPHPQCMKKVQFVLSVLLDRLRIVYIQNTTRDMLRQVSTTMEARIKG